MGLYEHHVADLHWSLFSDFLMFVSLSALVLALVWIFFYRHSSDRHPGLKTLVAAGLLAAYTLVAAKNMLFYNGYYKWDAFVFFLFSFFWLGYSFVAWLIVRSRGKGIVFFLWNLSYFVFVGTVFVIVSFVAAFGPGGSWGLGWIPVISLAFPLLWWFVFGRFVERKRLERVQKSAEPA